MTAIRTAIVIGSGVAGPVQALALQRAGIEASVYEAYPGPSDGVGGILMIAPNGLNALDLLDLREVVERRGQAVPGMVIEDGRSGRPIARFAGLPGLPVSQVVWRAVLGRSLAEEAAERGIRIEYGKRLVAVDEGTDQVTAHFADGSTASADLLIGADGIRSTVRTLIDPEAPAPAYVGLQSFAGFGGRAAEAESPLAIHFAQGRQAFLGYWTQPDGRIGWFSNLPWAEPLTLAEARAVPVRTWSERLRQAHADDVPAAELVGHTDPDSMWVFGPSELMPSVPHWYRDRLVLVGDSAHAPSSSSGQGASMAIESAIELARCLRDAEDLPTGLARYEKLRRPRVEKVAAYAARQNDQKSAGPVARVVFALLLPVLMRTVMTPNRTFGWMHGFRIEWDADSRQPAAV